MERTDVSRLRRWCWWLAAAAWFCFWPLAGRAADPVDTVRLADGSVVRGEILRLNEDDELVVDTVFSDDVAIEGKYIVGIEVSRPFTVRRLDGRKVTGYLAISGDHQVVVQDTPTVPTPLQVDTGTSAPALLGPVAPPMIAFVENTPGTTLIPFSQIDWIEETPTFYRYEAEFNVGVQAARGNTETTDLHFDGRFEPKFGWDTITLEAEYDKKKADGDTTTDRLLAALVYEHDFDRRWLGGVIGSFERDTQRDLKRRIISGAGGGYKLFDFEPTHLRVLLALVYVIEDFDVQANDREQPGALWRLDFERDLYKDDVSFYHHDQLVKSFTQASNLFVQTTTGLKVDISDFTLSAEVQFDWTNEPATDSKKQDTRYLLKIGYEFEGDENDWWQ